MTRYRIYKCTLWDISESSPLTGGILLPTGATPASVEEQDGSIVLYVKVPHEVATNERWGVKIVGTGHTFEDDGSWKFIGTVKLLNGKLMFHVFLRNYK